MNKHIAVVLVCLSAALALRAEDPFTVSTTLQRGTPTVLRVAFRVPAHHSLYEHMMQVEALRPTTVTLTPIESPPVKRKYDDLLEKEVSYYDADVTLSYQVQGLGDSPLTVAVSYQGCSEGVCFMPQRLEMVAGADGAVATPQPPAPVTDQAPEWRTLADQFTVTGTDTGYLVPGDFLRLLRGSAAGTAAEPNLLERVFQRYGLLAALLIVIPLGLLLNLTPCVLPMIPINLAIIGAGQSAGSKRSGFSRGAVYGAGMALAYAALGIVVVLTGSRFGALNSSPWFNVAIAVVFIGLALAMFDVVTLDFSRFQRGGVPGGAPGRLPALAVFLLGATAALLAGACVAPVLIWVLLLSASLYAQGHLAGLLLPLMLGVGMALPWPVAGAGMATLPRPGNWMNRIKHGFGVLILLFAAYYGVLSARLFAAQSGTPAASAGTASSTDGWTPDLTAGLRQALERSQPVILDFWALTCKSCIKMNKTTFKDPDVIRALTAYARIAIQTDDVNDPLVRGALDYYHVLGLPTYIVLQPRTPTPPLPDVPPTR
jgi:thiol:disulfide interchange protein